MALTKKLRQQEFTQTVSEFKWAIRNFSSISKPVISSRKIVICTTSTPSHDYAEWKLLVYPDGRPDIEPPQTEKGYISIFLHSCNRFKIRISFSVKISSNVRVYKTESVNAFTHTFHSQSGYGFGRILKRDMILDDLKKGNDTLTITFKLKFLTKYQVNPRHNLAKQVSRLLQTEKHYDVVLVANDNSEHKAHKAILATRSKVFSAMFQHNMKENKENVVKIEDVDNEILKEMLYFIYSGKINNIQKNAKKLMIVADKYDLDDLLQVCGDYLIENMKADNILELIEFAHTYDITLLEEEAKKFFLKNHNEVMSLKKRKSMKDLSRHLLEDLFFDLATSRAPNKELDTETDSSDTSFYDSD